MRLLTAVSLVRVQQGEPAKYSRNDTIRGYFFYAKSPDFLGFFALWSFGGSCENRAMEPSDINGKEICTHPEETRGSMEETRKSIII